MAAEDAPDQIGADVRELGREHGVEQQPAARPVDALERRRTPEQDQLAHETPQQTDVQHAEQRPADRLQRGRIVLLRKLAQENADHDQKQDNGIPGAVGAVSGAPAGEPGDPHERHAAKDAVAVEVRDAGGGHQLVELEGHDRSQRGQNERRGHVGHQEEHREQNGGDGKTADEAVLDGGKVHEGAPKRRWRREYSARASANWGSRKSGQRVSVK